MLHIRMPLWLAYDHWTGVRIAEKIIATDMAKVADPSLVVGTQAFMDKVDSILHAHSLDLIQRAHDLLSAPTLFGHEIGFNLPAFVIALVRSEEHTSELQSLAYLVCRLLLE